MIMLQFGQVSKPSRTGDAGAVRRRRKARGPAARRFRTRCSKLRQPSRVEAGTRCNTGGAGFIAAKVHYMPRRDGCPGPHTITLGTLDQAAVLANRAHPAVWVRRGWRLSVQGRAQRVEAGE